MSQGRTPEQGTPRGKPISFRLTEREEIQLAQQQADRGFITASAYIRYLIREDQVEAAHERKTRGR